MVCINTNTSQYRNIRFTHFVNIPSLQCVMGTAREDGNNRIKLFLIERNGAHIYTRDSIRDTWQELDNEQDYTAVRQLVIRAVQESAPCYSTDSLSNLN